MRKSMKKWIILCATLVIILAGMNVSAAEVTYKKSGHYKVYQGKIYQAYYEDTPITWEHAPAVLVNGNIMIPYQTAFVANGPKVKAVYRSALKRITFTYNDKKVKMYRGKKYMYVGKKKKKINTAPLYMKVDGKKYLYVPAKALCKALGLGYTYVKAEAKVYITKPVTVEIVTSSVKSSSNLTAKMLSAMTTKQFIETLGPIAQADYKKTGVLASVTLAQAINESGWGKTTLAQQGNNIFGMKIRLSENTWEGSVWDGKSYVTIKTQEEVKGKKVTISAKFRKYKNVLESVADHSAYLVNAKNGSNKRYAGLTATKSYSKQLSILQKGGYCTWSSYVSELTNLIKKYNLTKYDVK